MEELAAAAAAAPRHRERRRHRRKASDAAAYADVFGGPPRFAAPFEGVPADYGEVFGGVAASCSIPYLDLPPAAARVGGAGAGGYGEIFGRLDFGDFAEPYEDMLVEAVALAAEIASSSGSSRSSIRKESGQLDAEPSVLHQHHYTVDYDQHFHEEQFSPISSPPDGGQQFSMSYNKATRGRPDDIVEMTTCMVEPSISYVVDSCNMLNKSATNHVLVVDSDTFVNGEKGSTGLTFPSTSSLSASSDSVTGQNQHTPACRPISKNDCEDENYQKRSSTHSASSEDVPSPDYPFLRVSNNNLHTQPIKVQPPSMPPPKVLNRKKSKSNRDSEVSTNSAAAAAAAMKEAMEFAEARIKSAKELMERKGNSFKVRKKPGRHGSTKSTEPKESMTPEEMHVYEEKLTMRRLTKEEKTYEPALVNKNRESSEVKSAHCDHNEKVVLPQRKPHRTTESVSKVEQLGKWRSGAEFYELITPDQKCKTNSVISEGDNVQTTNPSSKLGQFEKGKGEATSGKLERCGKLLDGDDMTDLRIKHVHLREYDIGSMEVGHKAPTALEVSLGKGRPTHQELGDLHFKECAGSQNYQEGYDDDRRFENSCVSSIPPKLHAPEMSNSSLESCISGGHGNFDNKNPSDAGTEETLPLGKSNKDINNTEALEIPCSNEMPCISVRSQILQEYDEVCCSNIDETNASQVKVSKSDNSMESCETPNFQTMLSTVHGATETFEKEKMFSCVDEACLQNKNEVTKVPSGTLAHEEMEKFGTEEKACITLEDVVQKTESPGKEATITSESVNADENEVTDVFVDGINVMGTHIRTFGTSVEDSDQLQEPQGSLGPQSFENRTDRIEDLVCHGSEKEAKEPFLYNSEKSQVEEILGHDGEEAQTSMEDGTNKGSNDAYEEFNVRNDGEGNVLHSRTEVTIDDGDYTVKISICSKELHASFLESCTSKQHLSQKAESISAQTSDESTPVLENLGEDCRKTEREFPTENCTALQEEQTIGSRIGDAKDRLSTSKSEDEQSVHLDSEIVPKFIKDATSNFVQKSRDEIPDIQRIEGRDNRKKVERETEEVLRTLGEDKVGYRMKKENEQAKESSRRELEEEKERERERAKDRFAVQRDTREAHERAFADARAKAERIALERITLARQRASAEAREKEEKASAEAAAEKASREARIKAERAAVERATGEARERAIEKAKAAADAKERMERFRSSFKDSFKDNQQDKLFEKITSNNYASSSDSSNQVVEFESALRHKARSERHQRTAERAAKALAEKNMRDMLAQREQTERHRLAEFLDPEVRRWSNGKEGNLRALLSTLQYILGSDSSWQSVPLTDLITAAAVKKAYRRATLCVHPDKLQQRGATIRQKYICEKVFDLLKEAWNKFNSEEP